MTIEIQNSERVKVLRLAAVVDVTGLKRSMIYRLQAENRFPQSVKLTDYAVGWLDTEVQAWVKQRAARRQRQRDANTESMAIDH